MDYWKALHDLVIELDKHPRLISEKNDLEKKASGKRWILPSWPEDIRSFYEEVASYELRWKPSPRLPVERASGRVRLLPAKEVAGDWKGVVYFDGAPQTKALQNFRLIDFFADEAAVGFYDTADDRRGEVFLYFFEAAPIGLNIGFEAYVKLLVEARGYFYWQQALVAIRTGKDNAEAKDFKANMPQVFPDFSFDAFEKNYKSLWLK